MFTPARTVLLQTHLAALLCVAVLSLTLLSIDNAYALDYGDKGDGQDSGDFSAAPADQPKAEMDNPSEPAKPPGIKDQWASAIANDDTTSLFSLFNAHESPKELVPLTSKNGKDALMVASKTGNLEFVKELVATGARVNKVTLTGGTPFMFSVLGNEQAIARWLHEQGANIDAQGSNGWSAVTIAAAKGQADFLKWLISIGADINAADVYQFSPLMRAVENGHAEAVSVLLAASGIEIDSQDEAKNTALHYAVASGRTDLAELLLADGAKTNIVNRIGQTATSMAQDEPAFARLFETQ